MRREGWWWRMGKGRRDFDVDARGLMRLVRISRDLRFVWRMALFATLLWAAFVLTVERSVPEGSTQWARVDADASPGFIVLLVIAGVALVGQQVIRLAGQTGKAAGLIVPAIGDPAPIAATEGAENVDGLLPALRTNSYVGFGALTALLVITALLVAAIANVWPAWEGNHGHGGRVVTIGKDATVTSQAAVLSGRGGVGTINSVDAGSDHADAVGAVPHDGERWTLVSDPTGDSDSAYLVGGHAYVLALLLSLAILLLDGAIVAYIGFRISSERRRRRRSDHKTLADSYRALGAGARSTVAVGRPARGYQGRMIAPLTVIIGTGARP